MDEREKKCRELIKIMKEEGCTGFGDKIGKYFMEVSISKL